MKQKEKVFNTSWDKSFLLEMKEHGNIVVANSCEVFKAYKRQFKKNLGTVNLKNCLEVKVHGGKVLASILWGIYKITWKWQVNKTTPNLKSTHEEVDSRYLKNKGNQAQRF